MYLIHCERSRLCWVRTLSSSSVGRLSCFVVRLSHRCCHCCCCCRPRDICLVKASSPSSSGRGLVIRPPRRHRRPQAVCPAEASLSSLSSGPRCLSPTSLSSSVGHLPCKGLVAVIVRWGVTSSVPHCCRCHCRPPPTSSLSSTGHFPCKGLVAVIVRWGLRRLSPTIVTVVVIGHPPHRRCRCRPQAICPVEASSSLSSSGGLVVRSPHRRRRRWGSSSAPHIVVVIVRGSFVLRRPVLIVVWWGPRRPSPTSSSTSTSSSVGHLSCGGLITVVVHLGLRRPSPTIVVVIVVWWGPRRLSPTSSLSSSSAGHLSCGGLVAVVIQWGCLLAGPR